MEFFERLRAEIAQAKRLFEVDVRAGMVRLEEIEETLERVIEATDKKADEKAGALEEKIDDAV